MTVNVVITVRNGVVQEVLSDQREVYVTVIDLDLIAQGERSVEIDGHTINDQTTIAELDKVLDAWTPFNVW